MAIINWAFFFQDTIYVSDRSSYKSRVENRFYKIWYINKNNYDRRFFKTLNTPKAVTVYNIREKTCSDEGMLFVYILYIYNIVISMPTYGIITLQS